MHQPDDRWAERADAFARLLQAARDGEDWAWERIYHQFSPLVLGYLRGQRTPDVEDRAGEVFVQIVRDLGTFVGDEAEFRCWVMASTHRRLLALRQAEQDREPAGQPPREFGPHPGQEALDPESVDALSREELLDLLGVLGNEQRDVVLLRLIGGLTLAEVGEVIGRRPAAAKAFQRHALCVLQEALEGRRHPSKPDQGTGG